MPTWLLAGMWGLIAGGALVVGAAIAWWIRVPAAIIAGIMAFGAGVLISALAFELVDEAVRQGGAIATTIGFIAGAIVYVAANALLERRGARDRKRSGDQQPSEDEQSGSGAAIAIGALLDGIPESVVLGVSLLGGGGVSPAVLAAIFISNVPEGLSSLKGRGRSSPSWVVVSVFRARSRRVWACVIRSRCPGAAPAAQRGRTAWIPARMRRYLAAAGDSGYRDVWLSGSVFMCAEDQQAGRGSAAGHPFAAWRAA